jgi:hypothetical protein
MSGLIHEVSLDEGWLARDVVEVSGVRNAQATNEPVDRVSL